MKYKLNQKIYFKNDDNKLKSGSIESIVISKEGIQYCIENSYIVKEEEILPDIVNDEHIFLSKHG